ncbi:MAG: hypothetical protein M3R04_06160, partial [bacterium]|nr:hypothetical protein [bacterium]
VVGLGAGGNGTAWVALTNFAQGRYEIYGPFTTNATIPLGSLPDHGYLSALGQVYALVIVSGGASVSINHMVLSYDNLADPTFSIAGTIVDEHGSALPGIIVESNPNFKSAVTDLQGNYLIGVDAADTYTVTPQGNVTNHTFTPPDAAVVVNGQETGADFTGSRVDIIGHIENSDGVGTKGVLLTLMPGGNTTFSDANGNYFFANVLNNNYTVTPTLATYTFNPPNLPANVAGADVEGVDFEATGGAPTFTISGLVLEGGNPLQGVFITLTPGYALAQTDSLGFYKFSGLADQTDYLLTPNKGNYTFSPAASTVPVDGGSVPNQDF